jgi:hypothetical protein
MTSSNSSPGSIGSLGSGFAVPQSFDRDRSLSTGDGPQVRIVVGVSVFVTHLSTLVSRDSKSLLAREAIFQLKSGPIPLSLQFDRDPKCFLVIMQYLRTGMADFRKLPSPMISKLMDEATYFGLSGLKEKIQMEIERRNSPTLPRKASNDTCSAAYLFDDTSSVVKRDLMPVPDEDMMFDMVM